MCSFRTFRTLVLSAAFGIVLCNIPHTELVRNIIANCNQFFNQNNLTEVGLGEFFITPVLFKEGQLSQLDTLELLENPKIVQRQVKDGVTYDYDLNVRLKKLIIKYKFQIVHPILSTKGNFHIDVGTNSFHAKGEVSLGSDGNCMAILNGAYVNALNDYEIEIDPKDFSVSLLRKFYEGFLYEIVHREIPKIVNHHIQQQVLNETLREEFKNIVCSEIESPSGSYTETRSPEVTSTCTTTTTSDQIDQMPSRFI